MTVNQLIKILNAEPINIADGNRQVVCGYAGDFLSFVIGKAPSDCVWFTVMNNVNVCAVATLADVSAVVLCEGVTPDDSLMKKAREQGVNLIVTKYDIFNAVRNCCADIG